MEARQLLYQIRHSDLHPSFKWGKKKRAHVKQTGRERERDRENEDRRSYREEISKDDSNFLMESPEAGDWYASEEEGTRNNSSLWGEKTGQWSRVQ